MDRHTGELTNAGGAPVWFITGIYPLSVPSHDKAESAKLRSDVVRLHATILRDSLQMLVRGIAGPTTPGDRKISVPAQAQLRGEDTHG